MTVAIARPAPARTPLSKRLAAGIGGWAPAVVLTSALVAVWQWAAKAGHLPISIPAPSAVWDEFFRKKDTLWYHTQPTITAAAKGYVAAAVVAGLLSIMVVLWPRTAGPLYGAAVVISSIPLIALTPILVLWLDRGDAVRTTVAALAGFFPVLVGCVQGLRTTDVRTEDLFDTLSARRWQRFLYLRLPAALPFVFAGLKAAAASSVLGAIIAEWTGGGGTRGLGQMMTNALFGFNVPQTWLTIVTAAVLAVGAYLVIAIAEKLVIRWDHAGVDVGA